MSTPERRTADRTRQPWQPHPDLIRECAGAAECYGVDLGPMGEDALRRILSAAASWQERYDAAEREHARRRGDGLRAAEMVQLVERVQAHRNGNGGQS